MDKTNPCVPDSQEFQRVATQVSVVSIVGNLLLTAFKFIAGFLAHSMAMVSDAVHSASDVFSSIIVIIGIRISVREADQSHPYGHERFESVTAILLSFVLAIAGGSIGLEAVRSIMDGTYRTMAAPGMLALIAAVVSIIVKEAMFWYTRFHAKRIDSSALMAEAWHHRSDALSSIGALIGIGGARLGWPVLEPIASLLICLMILKVAVTIFKDAIDRMVDHACDPEIEKNLRELAERQEGVEGIDMLHTRMFGNQIYVDLEIAVDGNLSMTEAHSIAERVHNAVEEEFPHVKHIMVHVNPAGETPEKP